MVKRVLQKESTGEWSGEKQTGLLEEAKAIERNGCQDSESNNEAKNILHSAGHLSSDL